MGQANFDMTQLLVEYGAIVELQEDQVRLPLISLPAKT